jgi:hypothetical protein
LTTQDGKSCKIIQLFYIHLCQPLDGNSSFSLAAIPNLAMIRKFGEIYCLVHFCGEYLLELSSFLNGIHVLHTSKYSQTTTVIFTGLFLGLGAAGFYFSIAE